MINKHTTDHTTQPSGHKKTSTHTDSVLGANRKRQATMAGYGASSILLACYWQWLHQTAFANDVMLDDSCAQDIQALLATAKLDEQGEHNMPDDTAFASPYTSPASPASSASSTSSVSPNPLDGSNQPSVAAIVDIHAALNRLKAVMQANLNAADDQLLQSADIDAAAYRFDTIPLLDSHEIDEDLWDDYDNNTGDGDHQLLLVASDSVEAADHGGHNWIKILIPAAVVVAALAVIVTLDAEESAFEDGDLAATDDAQSDSSEELNDRSVDEGESGSGKLEADAGSDEG